MNYKEKELKEFKSDKPIVFDPPKEMLVWDVDEDNDDAVIPDDPVLVCAYIPTREMKVITSHASWQHCAEVPKEPKPCHATNIELMEWLAKGNGCGRNIKGSVVWSEYDFEYDDVNQTCDENIRIRKWSDTEWREPTIDYMGLAK